MQPKISAFESAVERRNTNSLKWTRYGTDVLPLWVADMDFQAPEPVLERLHRFVDHGVFGYEMPSPKLAEAVAGRMHRLYKWELSPEMVVATPGIVAAFKIAARAVCGTGEGVLVQPPIYHPFLELAPQAGLTGQNAPLRQINEEHTLRYEFDQPAFEAALNSNGARTGMFLLCQPHNPIGQIHSKSHLEKMAEACLRNGTLLCSDEIHSELLLGGARHIPAAALAPEIARQSITLVSASKTFNVVGLFCGFAIIPDPKVRSRYRQVLQKLGMHVNSLGLVAAEEAFSGSCEAWLADLRQYLTANREFIIDFVARELPGVRVSRPDATYLAWMDFGDLVKSHRIPANVQQFLLETAKVALNPGPEFGPGGEHFVRLNFGCPRSTLGEALRRIKQAVDNPQLAEQRS